MKLGLLLIGLLLTNVVTGQTWVLEKELTLKDSTHHWTSDEWGQLYQWKDNTVWLQQNQNQVPFQETFKILGEITDIQAISGLRALVFSEGQQMMGIMDNTLQVKEGLLAFFDFDFSNITQVAVSNRPDFIWLFDQYRERLILFNINTAQVVQLVDNCFGGIQDAQIIQFFEFQQNLICHLSDGRFYEFDRNLTLVKKLTLTPNLTLFGYQNEIWLQDQNWIEKLKPSIHSSRIVMPTQNYQQLQVLQDRFYFQQGRKISVYRLKM
jgi:Cdc6-like AAA superfamily ATPase